MKRFLSLVCISTLLFPHSIGWAAPAPEPTPTRRPDLRNFQDASLQECNNVCNRIVGSEGAIVDVTDNGAWGDDDDKWCADHGIGRGSFEAYSGAPSARSLAENCPFPVVNEGESCLGINDKMLRCEAHGSEIYNQCLAYKMGEKAGEQQGPLIAIDAVAAGVCGVACGMGAANQLGDWGTVCQITGTAAGAAQGIAALIISQNDFADAATGISMGAGVLGGATLLAKSVPQNNPSSATITTTAADGTSTSTNTHSQQDTSDTETGMACGTAALFAASTIIRAANLGDIEKARGETCRNISAQVAVDQDRIKRFLDSGGRSGGGRFSMTAGGGSATFQGGGNPFGTPTNVEAIENALNNPLVSAATDGGLLNRTGLGNNLKNRVPSLAPGILDAARRGDTAGMFAAALPKQAAALAGTLANVGGKVSQKMNSGNMLAQVGTYSGGGGGRGPAASGANPFGSLGAKNAGAGAGGPGAAMDFGATAESTDIWHSNTDENLFQIVSGRIHRVQRKQAFR